MRMFGMELYRIGRKKIAVCGMAAIMLFLLAYFWMSILGGEAVQEGEQIYLRDTGIRRDQEISAGYAGMLTPQKVQRIWDTYGAPLYVAYETTGTNDNFCNEIICKNFGEELIAEGEYPTYALRDGWQEDVRLNGNYYFTYAGGWIYFWDVWLMAFVMVCIYLAVMLSQVFTEDYSLHTADIILPSVHGRGRVWWVRLAAGICYAGISYLVVMLELLLLYGGFYGWEGWKLSIGLASFSMPWFPWNSTTALGTVISAIMLCGGFALLIHVLLTHAVSSCSRKPVGALVVSMLIFIVPFMLRLIFLDALRPTPMVKALYRICVSFPFQFAGVFLSNPGYIKIRLLIIAVTAGAAAAISGYRSYCRHQIGG